MADFDVEKVLRSQLNGLDDDILSYLISVVENMSIEEKRSFQSLNEVVGPFLTDSGFSSNDDEALTCCKQLSVAFGGSGFKSNVIVEDDDAPLLLSAPVKMIDNSDLKNKKHTYGGVVLVGATEGELNDNNHNAAMDAKVIPTTQKQIRKMRRENEQVQKILKFEAMKRAEAEAEMQAARMAAIKASRALGKQSTLGVNIERFSIPHPSGTADLLTDASLSLVPGRRYGLIGRNGSGTTLFAIVYSNPLCCV